MAEEQDRVTMGTYEKLAAPFPGDTVQRTKGSETRRGYDTTGIGYQFVVNRLNEVAGLSGWNYSYEIVKEMEGTYQRGGQFYDLTVEVSMWVYDPKVVRKAPGGHRAAFYADALKGALTNGLKKTAAMFGVARQAYEGTLDDDNLPSSAEGASETKEMSKSSMPYPSGIITAAQQQALQSLLDETKGDIPAFWNLAGVQTLAELPAKEYSRVQQALLQRKAKMKEAAK